MNQFSNFFFLQYDSVSTFQYLYTVNFSKNKPKALFLQLNKWLFKYPECLANITDCKGCSWKQIKKRRGREEQNRLWNQILISDYLGTTQSQHTQKLVTGRSEWHKIAPSSVLSTEQHTQSKQPSARKHLLLSCLQNEQCSLLHLEAAELGKSTSWH